MFAKTSPMESVNKKIVCRYKLTLVIPLVFEYAYNKQF